MANDINKEDPHYKGEYGSIYEVNRKFPTGGVAGDFVVIDGWAHYWNADRGTWCVNAERDSYWDELITNIIEKFKLVRGATYMGVASLATVPTKVIGVKMYYFATVAGTYKNFGGLVVPQGINVLYSENGSSWVNTTLLEVAQELGVSTNKVVSQKTLNDALAKKFDKESVAQGFGESEDKVVSQSALPFREIESPEFIKIIVDANDHLLFTINLDGEVDWGKGIPTPIRAKLQEIINQCQQDKTDLLESINNLNGILDKTTIKDEEGTVVETPFRYIQNEEFIFAKVDSEDKLLFGIQWDGTPKFGKTSAVEDRLQAQVNLLADKITAILGDDDTTSAIDTLKELKNFFASIDNTQTLTSILSNLNSVSTKLGEDIKNLQDTKVDKEEGKSLIEDEVKECFRVIENEEFLKAIVDSDDRVLYGIYRATGKPYYPLNEMYHVEQNEEFFAVWLDADDKVVLGIRRDGEIIGEIHAVNALKQVISQLQSDLTSLQEKVGTIDTNLKELLNVFSLQETPEYMAVEKDADGKVLAATYNDGSHYSHNLKSETIDAKVDKEEGKSLIDADVAIANTTIEDPEDRSNMELDSENRVLSHRDKNGIKNENVGFNTPNYYKNGEKCEWIEESDVIPIVKKSDDIPLSVLDGVSNHNTPNLIVPSDIQKTFNDGTHSFTPPNAGYEMSNRIECEAGDWFTRTGTATGMVVVTDSNDRNGQRLFNSNGTTLGSSFQIPEELTWVRYIRMAVDATAAKAGDIAICKGKNAFNGEQKGDFVTIDKLKVTSSNMPKDLKFIKTSNGDYYELYIDESDFSVKARKVDPSVITELPDDFPVFNCTGDFSKYFNSWVAMVDNKYLVERNLNGVTNYLKLGANAYGYAEFRKETTPGGIPRYVAMFPYTSYTGLKGEKGLTIYDKDFNVIDTNIIINRYSHDAHDFVYIDDNHLITFRYTAVKNVTLSNRGESLTKASMGLLIEEIKKIDGIWKTIASFDGSDYPLLLSDGVHESSSSIMAHWNTLQLDFDGNLIVNMRDMNCFWKIRRTVDSEGNVIIGSKTKDYNEAVIGRVGGIYNSAYIDSKRVLEEGFEFTDVPSSLTDISSDEIPLWKFYHEHDVTYWGKKEIGGKEYPTYTLFDNNMWTGETPTGNYYDINPRNNYKNNPNGNNDSYFINSKSDGGAYDERMVSRVVQLSIDWDNHLIKDYKVYEISKKYSYTRSSVQMFDEGVLFISWADQSFCGLFDFNDEQTIVDGKLYKNGKMLFSSQKTSYRVHGYK